MPQNITLMSAQELIRPKTHVKAHTKIVIITRCSVLSNVLADAVMS